MTTETPTVAAVILDQIGVPLRMEVGVRDLAQTPTALHFTMSAHTRRKIRVSVELVADLYTVRWTPAAIRSYDLHTVEGVYADSLRDLLRSIAAGNVAGWLR